MNICLDVEPDPTNVKHLMHYRKKQRGVNRGYNIWEPWEI